MRNTFTGISFLLICCIASCTSLEYDQVGPRDLKNPDKRIALIGFYPFQRKVVSVQRFGNQQITNYEASIARQSPYFSAVGFGQPIDEYPVTGRQPISEERYKKLAGLYLGDIRVSGVDIVKSYLEITDEGRYFLKLRDVDYYLMGIHLPAFSECSTTSNVLEFFAHAFSIFTYPHRRECVTNSKFILLNSDFEELHTFTYQTNIKLTTAWWTIFQDSYSRPDEYHPPRVTIENDIHRMQNEIIDYLQ